MNIYIKHQLLTVEDLHIYIYIYNTLAKDSLAFIWFML